MKTRNITYDSSNYTGESDLNLEDAKDLFLKMDWSEKGSFYTIIFGDSFLQFIAETPRKIIVEIMLDEDKMLIAVKTLTKEDAVELIEYYFENDNIGDISTFEQTQL